MRDYTCGDRDQKCCDNVHRAFTSSLAEGPTTPVFYHTWHNLTTKDRRLPLAIQPGLWYAESGKDKDMHYQLTEQKRTPGRCDFRGFLVQAVSSSSRSSHLQM